VVGINVKTRAVKAFRTAAAKGGEARDAAMLCLTVVKPCHAHMHPWLTAPHVRPLALQPDRALHHYVAVCHATRVLTPHSTCVSLPLYSGSLCLPKGAHQVKLYPWLEPTWPCIRAGIWTPGGVSSDGKSLFAVTGNTDGATTYSDGNGVFKFQSGPVFRATSPNYFAPSQWKQYDDDDIDLCGSEPVVLDLPGETLPDASAGSCTTSRFGLRVQFRVTDTGQGERLSHGLARLPAHECRRVHVFTPSLTGSNKCRLSSPSRGVVALINAIANGVHCSALRLRCRVHGLVLALACLSIRCIAPVSSAGTYPAMHEQGAADPGM